MILRVTPRDFLVRALVLSLAFLVAHFLGLREQTRFLSGTPSRAWLGVIYVFLYFAFVLVVPSLVLGAGILAVIERFLSRRSSPPEEPRAGRAVP